MIFQCKKCDIMFSSNKNEKICKVCGECLDLLIYNFVPYLVDYHLNKIFGLVDKQ